MWKGMCDEMIPFRQHKQWKKLSMVKNIKYGS